MRTLPVALRATFFGVAVLQLLSGAALSVLDGFSRSREIVLAAHVEDVGATHNTRAHAHDCSACRELRAGYVAPPALPVVGVTETRGKTFECGPAVAGLLQQRALCARAPPPAIG